MRRENRRVAAMSWNAGDDTMAPPKTTRGQMDASGSSVTSMGAEPQTYIIAQNPAVLAHLMRENEQRGLNAAAYTTPASVFNSLAVDFDATNNETNLNNQTIQTIEVELPLKTVPLPATELLKLDPLVGDKVDKNIDSKKLELNKNSSEAAIERFKSPQDNLPPPYISPQSQPQSIANYPIPCEIINTLTQQAHSLDPAYKALQKPSLSPSPTFTPSSSSFNIQSGHNYMPTNLPPPHNQYIPQNSYIQQQQQQQYQQQLQSPHMPQSQPQYSIESVEELRKQQNQNSLERNMGQQNIVSQYAARLNSLERAKQQLVMEYNGAVANSTGNNKAMRSNSLTRQFSAGQHDGYNAARSASLERSHITNFSNKVGNQAGFPQSPMAYGQQGQKGGSLERNQSVAIVNDMINRGYKSGSLERNPQGLIIANRGGSLERNVPYQPYRAQLANREPPQEPFQEEIYDFGGVNVKSCASIALKKSVEKGLLPASAIPPNYALPPPYSAPPPANQQVIPKYAAPLSANQTPQRMWAQPCSLTSTSNAQNVFFPASGHGLPLPPNYNQNALLSPLAMQHHQQQQHQLQQQAQQMQQQTQQQQQLQSQQIQGQPTSTIQQQIHCPQNIANSNSTNTLSAQFAMTAQVCSKLIKSEIYFEPDFLLISWL